MGFGSYAKWAIPGYAAYRGGKAIVDALDEPYDEKRAATDKAGKDLQELGETSRDYAQTGKDEALGKFDTANNYWNQLFGAGGSQTKPGRAEDLYGQMLNSGGYDPYSRMAEVGQRNIDNASAARGGFNSGASMRATAEMNADIASQRARDMFGYASQADAGQRARETGGLAPAISLGGAQAGTVGHGYDVAGEAYQQGTLGRIQAELQKAGVSMEQQKMYLSGLGWTAEQIAKLYGSKK